MHIYNYAKFNALKVSPIFKGVWTLRLKAISTKAILPNAISPKTIMPTAIMLKLLRLNWVRMRTRKNVVEHI